MAKRLLYTDLGNGRYGIELITGNLIFHASRSEKVVYSEPQQSYALVPLVQKKMPGEYPPIEDQSSKN